MCLVRCVAEGGVGHARPAESVEVIKVISAALVSLLGGGGGGAGGGGGSAGGGGA